MEANVKTANRELTITKVVNATQENVWEVWTKSKHVSQWWGPKGSTMSKFDWEAKEGNKIIIHIKGADGVIYPIEGKFTEVIKPKKLAFKTASIDKTGKPLLELLNNLTLTKLNNKTEYTLHVSVSKVSPEAESYLEGMLVGMNNGLKQSLDNFEEYLSKNKF